MIDSFIFSKTIGTTWTSQASESMKIDETIKISMSTSFFDLFSTDIGISLETGYDWTHTSSRAKSETEQFHVETIVKPRKLLFSILIEKILKYHINI